VSHRGHPVGIERGKRVALDREGRGGLADRPRGRERQPVAQPEPDVRAARAGPLGDHARDPWQDVITRIGLADALAEAGEHLVGGRPLAEHEPVREPVRAVAHRLERDRDQRRRRDPKEQRVAKERSETHHDHDVDRGDEHGQHPEHERLPQHEVDVVEVVLEDRHADRDRDQGQDESLEEVRPSADPMVQGEDEPEDRHATGQHQPSDLLAFVPMRPAVPDEERRDRRRHQPDHHERQDDPGGGDGRSDRSRSGERVRRALVVRVRVVASAVQREGDRPQRRGDRDRPRDRPPAGRGEMPVWEQQERVGEQQGEDRNPGPVAEPHRDRFTGSARMRRLHPGGVFLDHREEPGSEDPDDEVDPADRVPRLVDRDDEADDADGREGQRLGDVGGLEGLVADQPEREHPEEHRHSRDPDRPGEPSSGALGHGASPTGRRPATAVPSPGAEVTASSPPRAASRSAIPCRPVP